MNYVSELSLDWHDHSSYILNFRKIIRFKAEGNDCQIYINQGMVALTERFNKLAEIRWKLVKSNERIDNFLKLDDFLLSLKNLPLNIDQNVIKHGELVLNSLERYLTDEDKQLVSSTKSKRRIDQIRAKLIETYTYVSKEILNNNILSAPEKAKLFRVLETSVSLSILYEDQLSEVTQKLKALMTKLDQLPVASTNKSNQILITKPFRAGLLNSLKQIKPRDRRSFNSSNGIAPTLFDLKISYNHHGTVDITNRFIKNSLPLFKKRVNIESNDGNSITFRTKLGLIRHYKSQVNFEMNDVHSMCKVALKIAKSNGWPSIYVWGTPEFKASIQQMAKKHQITVNIMTDQLLNVTKAKIETEDEHHFVHAQNPVHFAPQRIVPSSLKQLSFG